MLTNRQSDQGESGAGRYIHLIRADEYAGKGKTVRELSRSGSHALNEFLRRARDEPGAWHRLSNSSIAFRAVLAAGGENNRFELRSDRKPCRLYTYQYDYTTGFLTCWLDRQTEQSGIATDHSLPDDVHEFATCVASVLHDNARRHVQVHAARAGGLSVQDTKSGTVADASWREVLSRAVFEAGRHWFEYAQPQFTLQHRVLIATVGSLTFYLGWLVFVIQDPTKQYIL